MISLDYEFRNGGSMHDLIGMTDDPSMSVDCTDEMTAVLKARGFVVKPRADGPAAAEQGWQRAPQMRKLRAMWYLLADGAHVDRPADMAACNAGIEAWAKRQLRHQRVVELRGQGLTQAAAARATGYTVRQVINILNRNGFALAPEQDDLFPELMVPTRPPTPAAVGHPAHNPFGLDAKAGG